MGKFKAKADSSSRAPKWGEVRNGVRFYPLHAYQDAILSSSARITFAFAGTGGGKSVIIPLWLIGIIAKNNGKGRYLVVSPTYKIFKQSRLLDAWFEAIEGTDLQGTFNKTDAIYTCATGAEVFFRSGENPNSLESGQYDGLVLDEAAKLSYDAWVKASARVGAAQSPILGVTTPDISNWIYSDIFKLTEGGTVKLYDDGAIRDSADGSIRVVQWQSTVNPTYSKAELERQRKILPEAVFRRRYLGEFAKLDGLVYPTFADAIIPDDTPDILPSPAVRVCGSIDWGWHDPCAILVGAECQDGVIYLVDEIYGSKIALDDLASRLNGLKKKWLIDVFFVDHSRPEIAATLRKYGIPCRMKSVAQIETGIGMVDQRLRGGYLRVYEGSCPHLIDEASHYQRKSDRDGDFSEKAIDKDNHACDSLRYLITGMDKGRRLNFSSAVEEESADTEMAAMVRLGKLSADPEEQRIQREKAEKEAYDRWFYEMAFGDLDD